GEACGEREPGYLQFKCTKSLAGRQKFSPDSTTGYHRFSKRRSPSPDPAMPLLDIAIERQVARVALNRPDVHNAFDDALIAGLTTVLAGLDADAGVRAVVLTGNGASFSAGADLNW